ncbi:MAG: hypothetical protein WBD75_06250 [Phycisphaerae bacterium]
MATDSGWAAWATIAAFAGAAAAWVGVFFSLRQARTSARHAVIAKEHKEAAQKAARATERSADALQRIAAGNEADHIKRATPKIDYDSRDHKFLVIKNKGDIPFEVLPIPLGEGWPKIERRVLKPESVDPHENSYDVPVPDHLAKACAQGEIQVVSGCVSLCAEDRTFESHFRWNMKGAFQEQIVVRDPGLPVSADRTGPSPFDAPDSS